VRRHENERKRTWHSLVPTLPVRTEFLQPRGQVRFVARVWELEILAHIREDSVRLAVSGDGTSEANKVTKRKESGN
jgi:hypothetical protein